MQQELPLKDPHFIKKARLDYRLCQGQGLHQGEQLTLVCVDSKCNAKGLICPVCKETSHKDHKVMHLKLFLSQLHSQFSESSSGEGAEESKKIKQSVLVENLQKLEATRKLLSKNLQDTANSLAQMVKQLE